MSPSPNVGLTKWHLGIGAFTGAIYYFTNASNRQHFQNYFYHMVSTIFTELGHVSIMIFTGICIISFTKLNYNLVNSSTSGFAGICSRSIVNIIFILLRCISAFKLVIAVLRGLIKARKFTKFENKAMNYNKKRQDIDISIEKLNNRCIICLEDLYNTDKNLISFEKKKLVLGCEHIFHLDCFKQWYVASENCPYCREKVEI